MSCIWELSKLIGNYMDERGNTLETLREADSAGPLIPCSFSIITHSLACLETQLESWQIGRKERRVTKCFDMVSPALVVMPTAVSNHLLNDILSQVWLKDLLLYLHANHLKLNKGPQQIEVLMFRSKYYPHLLHEVFWDPFNNRRTRQTLRANPLRFSWRLKGKVSLTLNRFCLLFF